MARIAATTARSAAIRILHKRRQPLPGDGAGIHSLAETEDASNRADAARASRWNRSSACLSQDNASDVRPGFRLCQSPQLSMSAAQYRTER